MANIFSGHLHSNELNYMAESHIESSHDAIKVDLANKIIYDDPAVFRRLRVGEVDETFVAACMLSLQTHNKADIALLKSLAEQAAKKSPEMLEYEEANDKIDDDNREERSATTEVQKRKACTIL